MATRHSTIAEKLREAMRDAEKRGDHIALKSIERIVKMRKDAPSFYRPLDHPESSNQPIILTEN